MSDRLNKIENVLTRADVVLFNIEEQTMDPRPIDMGVEGIGMTTPPGVNPGSISTHGYSYPWWLLPPNPGNHPDHPMYGIWLSMPSAFRSILNFDNFLSLLRFIIAPHIPNTIFNRIPGLRRFLNSFMGTQAQNVLRDLLRSWMLDNLNLPQEILQNIYPGIFDPLVKPGTPGINIPGGIKPIGGGGVIPPTGGGFISNLADIIYEIVPNLITGPISIPIGEQMSSLDRMREKHRDENKKLRTKHEREIDAAQRRERTRRRTQRQG